MRKNLTYSSFCRLKPLSKCDKHYSFEKPSYFSDKSTVENAQ